MAESFVRISAIARAEIRFRFRRTTSLVAWLVVAALVYIIIPNPKTGWALMRISGMRVWYNSAAVALGTGVFCSLILSFAGYYLVSNSLRRDIISRTGTIIAATPMTNLECLGGKFIGNLTYLSSIPLACMVSAMLMFLLRGESSVEPLVFLSTYVWLIGPVVVFCSAIALAFESHARSFWKVWRSSLFLYLDGNRWLSCHDNSDKPEFQLDFCFGCNWSRYGGP